MIASSKDETSARRPYTRAAAAVKLTCRVLASAPRHVPFSVIPLSRTGLRARRILGFGFGGSLASATVAAVSTLLPRSELSIVVAASLGAGIGAAFSSLIGVYALSWRSAGIGAACGAAVGIAAQTTMSGWGSVVGCWVSAAVASWAVGRERLDAVQMATPPGLVVAIHVVQLPLILFSAVVSLVSARPRPFVVMFTVSAFGLWGLLGGECPLSRAEEELRALRGERVLPVHQIGFIAYHIHRRTGLLLPEGSVFRLAYAAAAITFTWYVAQALR